MKIHPLGAKGKYYVDIDNCTWCAVCLIEAPENFTIPEDCYEGAFVYKQPETSEEEKQCESAMLCCPHIAIFDDGEMKNL